MVKNYLLNQDGSESIEKIMMTVIGLLLAAGAAVYAVARYQAVQETEIGSMVDDTGVVTNPFTAFN